MSPTVGVVIPVHDHEAYVGAAIRSVLTQSRPPERLVVVDDGSRDGSLEAAHRAVAEHARTGVDVEVRGQRNVGAATTLNRELSRLDTDVLTILNSDDLWHPRRLERMLPELAGGRTHLVFSDVAYLGAGASVDDYRRHHARMLRWGRNLPSVSTALRLWNLAVSTGNLMMTRELWTAIGPFDTGLPIAHDWEFLLRAAREVEPVLHPDALLRYRLHDRNTSRTERGAAGDDLAAILQVQLAQGVAATRNPSAATAENLPLLLPFLVPLWESTLGPGEHPVPRALGTRASEILAARGPDGPLLDAADQRRMIAALLAYLRRGPDGGSTEAPAGPARRRLAVEAAAGWRTAVHTPTPPSPVRRAGAGAAFTWDGRTITVHSERPGLLDDLADLIGVAAVPRDLQLGRADLNVIGDHDVVTRSQLRRFADPADRLVWSALTLSEFLTAHVEVAVHAATILVGGRAVVATGPPHAGKSTLAANALDLGLPVLGDDHVRIVLAADGVRAEAFPRPLKLRPRGDRPAARTLRDGRDGHLDGQPVTLLSRPTVGADTSIPVAAVVHLRRRDADGVGVTAVPPSGRPALLTPQLRGTAVAGGEPAPPARAARAALAELPTFSVAVGPDADVAALRDVVAAVERLAGARCGP